MTRNSREHWGSKLGFLMAAAGSAIGLGSLWRFPYMTAVNGGGLFVLCYILCTFIVALPIFIAELIVGRHAQKGPVDALTNLSPPSSGWRNIGWLCVACNVIILSFYSVISGWSLHYLLLSLQNFTQGKTPQQIAELFDLFYASADLNVFWLGLFLVLNACVVFGGVKKGIEKWAQVLTPLLFILMALLIVYCSTLSGFKEAFFFLFSFDWSLFSPQSALEALGMAFFTMSVGLGIIITYGSYMQPNQSIPTLSISVAALNILVSLMSALIIFSMIFSFGFSPDQGPGLVFKILPVLFAQLPATQFLCSLFFLILLLTAITSSISVLEVLVATGMETWNWSRQQAVITWVIISFILALPSALSGANLLLPSWKTLYGQDFLSMINTLPDWILAFCALSFAWFIIHIVPKHVVQEEFERSGGKVSQLFFPIWKSTTAFIVPCAIVAIIVYKLGFFSIL